MKRKITKNKVIVLILAILALASVCIDLTIESKWCMLNEINRLLFSALLVVAGFWITAYFLFMQTYKDRYPIKLVGKQYMPLMKRCAAYIIYGISYGCVVIIRNEGLFENIVFLLSSFLCMIVVMKCIYETGSTLMINSYVDDFCKKLSEKLYDKENSIRKNAFKDIEYIFDECVVKEEYFVAQNISKQLGKVFRDFLNNSISLLTQGEERDTVQDSFMRIVDVGVYQLELTEEISSDLLVADITKQQVRNVELCIETGQYEWYKKYIRELVLLAYRAQRNGKKKVVSEIFSICRSILKTLILKDMEEWLKYLLDQSFAMTMSLNYLERNINLKHFASLITYGLINSDEGALQEYMFSVFKKFTYMVCRISKGFSDIKVYYALYFDKIMEKNNKGNISGFFEMIFEEGQDNGSDTTWTEFRFYCIQEVMARYKDSEIDIDSYHKKLLVEVIEMKEPYTGNVFLPKFKDCFQEKGYSSDSLDQICGDIKYLLNKCIINDNLSFFFYLLKDVSSCMADLDVTKKDMQINIFKIYLWLVNRSKRLSNKQFLEITFNEIKNVIEDLDKKRAISKDFGGQIISKLSDLARQADSDSYIVILQVIEILYSFLEENNELYFVCNSQERKKQLYRSVFNIATSCIENDFEEGLRRCSNTIGWFIIYSINQKNAGLTNYLIQLAKEMLDISIDMNISTKTQTFLLTLFTIVGMYCCKDAKNHHHIGKILEALAKVDKRLVYTAIKIRTYENDMWDSLFDKNTERLSKDFRKRYDEYCGKR